MRRELCRCRYQQPSDSSRQYDQTRARTNRDLLRLSEAEARLYDDLRNNRYADALRLEQEKISFAFFKAALADLE